MMLKTFWLKKNVTGLSTIEKGVEDELFVFLKLFILLYADDTVIMAESATDLQYALDSFLYARWKRDVLWYGDVRPVLRPSIRPSVRPSVRPSHSW